MPGRAQLCLVSFLFLKAKCIPNQQRNSREIPIFYSAISVNSITITYRSGSEFKALCKGGNESFQVIFNILKKTSDVIRFNLTELRIYLVLVLRFLAKLWVLQFYVFKYFLNR